MLHPVLVNPPPLNPAQDSPGMRPELTLPNWRETASPWAPFEVHFPAQQLGEKSRRTGECKGGQREVPNLVQPVRNEITLPRCCSLKKKKRGRSRHSEGMGEEGKEEGERKSNRGAWEGEVQVKCIPHFTPPSMFGGAATRLTGNP